MERSTPVRKPYASTADLLTWSETPAPDSARPGSGSSRPNARPHQPSDGISKVVFGGQVTGEEAESLNKRKPCSGYKMKEITGSGIFLGSEENDPSESGNSTTTNNRTEIRMYQPLLGSVTSPLVRKRAFLPEN